MSAVAFDLDRAIAGALAIVRANLATFRDVYPDDTTQAGVYRPRRGRKGYPDGSNVGWTTGFWAGLLWLAYELTDEAAFRQAAEIQVARFADRLAWRMDVETHDLGFLYSLSCVAAWRLVGSDLARRTALQAADLLLARFFERAGIIQAWGSLDDPRQRGRAIVDSLMNLPLLYWAGQVSGSPRYRDAAERHARQLAQHLVRADGSTAHTRYFDPHSGTPLAVRTHQGLADQSTWARGQAWAMAGLPLSYAYTRDPWFLAVAERVGAYFLDHTPADGVVYWDLTFGDGSGEPKDSSASAIAACGLLEQARWGKSRAAACREAALAIVTRLADGCAARPDAGSGALLLHGVQSKPAGQGVDEGNLWGDYFYLEALARLGRPAWTPAAW